MGPNPRKREPDMYGPPSGPGRLAHPLAVSVLLVCGATAVAGQERNAYFGDLHIHTRYSFDAYVFGTRTTPADAYRFALGQPIRHAAGFDIQLDRPLDFAGVTDHANFLGMMSAMADPNHPLSKLDRANELTEPEGIVEQRAIFRTAGPYITRNLDDDVRADAWQRIIEAADRFNDPGTFTAFVAYEYTSGFGGNLHRNVVYRGSDAPRLPYGRLDSLNPEDLWDWMDQQRELGFEALAIPHNPNASNGLMFDLRTFEGEPLDADYAAQRMRNEPIVEMTQVKGTSDTHPFLSPNDEWADFEIFPYKIARWEKSQPRGSYVREAWGNGLALEESRGFNPYRFGVIGASDTHNSGGSFEEDNFFSKVGTLDQDGQHRGSVPVESSDLPVPTFYETYYRFWGASGLAGVWAEENTREALFDAMRRKETFATSGPRMKVRFFAGTDLPTDIASRDDAATVGYAQGVPMGGDLNSGGAEPRFFAWALKDPQGTDLQRLQIIKVWAQDGRAAEKIYDVACAGGAQPDPATRRCPDNEASVDLTNCSTSARTGASELKAAWRDPEWRDTPRASYYVRVLENPTCRWSTWDAMRAGTAPRPDLPATIQERAWSSPIWVRSGR